MDLEIEAFNIAAFIKQECITSLERERKQNEESNVPTLNVSRYVDYGSNEIQSGISHRTNQQTTEKAVFHDNDRDHSAYMTTE